MEDVGACGHALDARYSPFPQLLCVFVQFLHCQSKLREISALQRLKKYKEIQRNTEGSRAEKRRVEKRRDARRKRCQEKGTSRERVNKKKR